MGRNAYQPLKIMVNTRSAYQPPQIYGILMEKYHSTLQKNIYIIYYFC